MPRSAFDFTAACATRPRLTKRSGIPATWARPRSMRTSAAAHSSSSAATRDARWRTSRADLAARIDANGRPLERAEPCPLGITPEPDPQALFGLRARLLPAAPVLVAEESQCAFEGRGKITRIVGDRDAVLVREARTVRHLVGAHQIAAPDVGRVEAEAPRTEVHEALHDEHRLRTPRRTVRRVRRLGGDDARSRVPVRRHAVRTGKMVHR